MALRVISIITAGHCLCNYEDYEPTASVYCKENGHSSDAENTDPYNFVPVNQHLGPYQPLENNGLANAIYALFGSKDLNDISENKWLARDAYVMSAIKTDGKVILSGLRPDPQRYFDYHHAPSDTFDKINRRELELGAAAMTALIYLMDNHKL